MSKYGAGSTAGVFRSIPERTYVSVGGSIAIDTSQPYKSTCDISDPVRFAPVKFRPGPTMYPPDAVVVT